MKARQYMVFIIGFLVFFSCKKDDDIANRSGGTTLDVNSFVWRAMNIFYYWRDNVEYLSDDFPIKNKEGYQNLIKNDSPEELFDKLRYRVGVVDRNSVILNDYTTLEKLLNRISVSSGFRYALCKTEVGDKTFLLVLYVLPGTSAAKAGLKRGNIITTVNNNGISRKNLRSLLSQATLKLGLSTATKNSEGHAVLSNVEKTITVQTSEMQEDPIFMAKVFEDGSKKIGYLVYNGFLSQYHDELNKVFAEFKSKKINDLILDLRYNGGGSVETSTYLASMITGQFSGKLYTELRFNKKVNQTQKYQFTDKMNLYNLKNNQPIGTEMINHLKLNRLIVLTTDNTASASELIINGLRGQNFPVILIGEKTYGKNVASATFYDSPDFTKENLNPDHRYAIQPIIAQSYNALEKSDYGDGFSPDIAVNDLPDGLVNIQPLGEPNESMLNAALQYIEPAKYKNTKNSRELPRLKIPFKKVLNINDLNSFSREMTTKMKP